MKIAGFEISYLSEWDGLPVKNHLPSELKERMKTENQWLEAGYVVKAQATAYELHPSALAKRTCTYYLDEDVEAIHTDNAPRNCMTCSIRSGHYCPVASDYVGSSYCCSEYEPLFQPDGSAET